MLDLIPWFVGGGAEHSPAVARMLAHAATQGSNGVIGFSDLKVSALDVPGTDVLVAPGGAILNNIYPGGTQQSYMGRNITSTAVPIPATGSTAGATRFVIMRIDDPEFGGQAPANPTAGPYIRFAVVSSLNGILYPHVPLARIVQPASTGTITNAMITDLREMANPRQKREIAAYSVTSSEMKHAFGTWAQWPVGVTKTVPVPAWATRVEGFARVHQPLIMNGKTFGQLRFKLTAGSTSLQSGLAGWDFNDYGTNANGVRSGTLSIVLADTIPAGLRGQNVTLSIEGLRGGTGAEAGYLRADPSTHIEFDLEFQERPV